MQARDIERLSARKWEAGDVYTPHDLTPLEIMKYKKLKMPTKDVFDALGINPINEYKVEILLLFWAVVS